MKGERRLIGNVDRPKGSRPHLARLIQNSFVVFAWLSSMGNNGVNLESLWSAFNEEFIDLHAFGYESCTLAAN
jgi:hypothetical protein